MISFAVFVFGLAIGSFLNAFLYRLELQQGLRQISRDRKKTGVTVFHGRSFCPYCEHVLAWYDLIPILSFAFLLGRCRYCKEKISFQYPVVELVTGIMFLAVFNLAELSLQENLARLSSLAYLWAIGAILVAVFVYDLKHFLIPDILVYSAIGLVALWRVFEFFNVGNFETLLSAIAAGLGASAFFLAIYLVSRGRWMGFGDVKLAFVLGVFLGWPFVLVALFFSFCLGAVVGLCLIMLKKKGLKSEVPFAPFLIMGTVIALFFGSPIIHWYLNLFLV